MKCQTANRKFGVFSGNGSRRLDFFKKCITVIGQLPVIVFDAERIRQMTAKRIFAGLFALITLLTLAGCTSPRLPEGRYSAAVLAVTSAGGVRTRVARVDTGLTRDDAANLAQLLNRGLTFVAPQDLSPMLMASMVLAAGERLAPVVMAAQALVTTGPQACLEGAQYLAKMPDVRQNLGTLLEIFSDNAAATELIRPEGNRITATLGSDLDPEMPGACIVSKRYLAGGGLTGSVALIGSTRMEYQRLLPVLDYFAAKLGQSMAGQGQ